MKKIEASAEQKLMVVMGKLERQMGGALAERLDEVWGGEAVLGIFQRWADAGWQEMNIEHIEKKVGGKKGRGHIEVLETVRMGKFDEAGQLHVRLMMRRVGENLRYHGMEKYEAETNRWVRLDPMAASHILGSLR